MGRLHGAFLQAKSQADIYIHDLEKKIMNSQYKTEILYYGRYVDDIIILWRNNTNIHDFHRYLNNIDQNMSFTIELENNNKLNFLDLTIEKRIPNLVFNIFRKTTNSNTIITADSNHSMQHKLAAFNSMIYRATNIPLSPEAQRREMDAIRQIARNNGYNEKMVNNIHSRHKNRKIKQQLGLQIDKKTRNVI